MIQRMGIVSKLLYIKAIENDELPMRITRGRVLRPPKRKKKKGRKFHRRCVNGFPRFSRGKHLVLMTQLKGGITGHYR